MKAIIFDVDNTLIMWRDEFLSGLITTLKELHYDFSLDEIREIDNAIEDFDKIDIKLTKENILDYINKRCNLDFNIDFINKLIVNQGNLCVYEDDNLTQLIKYLSNKYDLYVISNWFTDTQKLRLERMHILEYFKGVYGADINFKKPDSRCFDIVLSKYTKNECIMIGDSLVNDIEPAERIGMKALWLTNRESDKYRTIKSLEELKEIL